ncbi:MAG: MBOAT family protein [Planctomycetes bacterium]|nr:MBOAT family protein [Planctomycetota bacterium]
MKQLSSGALLILIGLVRKVAIADVLAGEVDKVFVAPGDCTSVELMRAIFFFALQIYGDFAGYSDIARGTSRMLGIELMENFNHPYFATNITTFWRRWHISLSSWLRDYLYIPLGGNRGPTWFVYRNLFLTMLLGGLWHGAGWNFVIWGGLHGVGLAIHKLWVAKRTVPNRPNLGSITAIGKALLSWMLTMALVGFAWIFFRASDFGSACEILSGIVMFRGGLQLKLLLMPVGMTLLLLFIDIPQYVSRDHTVMLRWPWVVRGLVYVGFVFALLILGVETNVSFIYFQF